jgi:hypothetical protein
VVSGARVGRHRLGQRELYSSGQRSAGDRLEKRVIDVARADHAARGGGRGGRTLRGVDRANLPRMRAGGTAIGRGGGGIRDRPAAERSLRGCLHRKLREEYQQAERSEMPAKQGHDGCLFILVADRAGVNR